MASSPMQFAARRRVPSPARITAWSPLLRPVACQDWASAGCLLVLAFALIGCATTSAYQDSPRVSLTSIQPKEMTLLEQRYSLQLRIMNPNDAALPVQGLSYALEINGREFAYGVSNAEVSIPPYGEALLDVEVVSSLLNIMQQVQEIHGGQRDSLSYRLSGKLSLENAPARLPFEYAGELKYLPAVGETPVP